MPLPLRTVAATRYVTPLREGGSLPALVEADDDGLYVLKFHGAGQGPKALVAELVAGEIGRHLGLLVPEIVFVELDPVLARAEPDQEIQDLIERSAGLNVGLDFLPGALPYNPAVGPRPTPEQAADIVWFDALVTNVDRTAKNVNLLAWHGRLWLIDHGAALYIQHTWRSPAEHARRPFANLTDHVLLPFAGSLAEADARLAPRLTVDALEAIVAAIPDRWLTRPTSAPPMSTISAAGSRRRGRSFRPMPDAGHRSPFEYALVRVVPRVERGERINAGVIVFSRPRRFLAARTHLDEDVLRVLAPGCDPAEVRPHLAAIEQIAHGDAAGGPMATLALSERFHWLVSPSSTIVQPSEVHTGLTEDPAATLEHLFATLVRGRDG